MEERGQPGTPPLQERAADRPDRWRPRQSTAIGGLLIGRPGNVRAGTRLVGVGLVLFLLGAAFFEGVIWGGYEFSRSTGTIAAVLIIVLGAVLLILNMTSGRRGSS